MVSVSKSLFEASERVNFDQVQLLAVADASQSLDQFVGQQHFLGDGKLFRRLLKADRIGSVIFYGPPGSGKTTLGACWPVRAGVNFDSSVP